MKLPSAPDVVVPADVLTVAPATGAFPGAAETTYPVTVPVWTVAEGVPPPLPPLPHPAINVTEATHDNATIPIRIAEIHIIFMIPFLMKLNFGMKHIALLRSSLPHSVSHTEECTMTVR